MLQLKGDDIFIIIIYNYFTRASGLLQKELAVARVWDEFK